MKRQRDSKEVYIVGIDPQPTLFAVQCKTLDGIILAWFNIHLKKKARFDSAQLWQEYIYQESHALITKTIPTHCYAMLGGYQKPDLVTIEQQKGRVCSIIETSLLNVCLQENIPAWIANAMCWKRKTNTPCTKYHYQNKKVVEKIVEPILNEYFTPEELEEIKKSKRKHDLCDANQITDAGIIYYKGKEKIKKPRTEPKPTSSCDEKHLKLYMEVQAHARHS